MRWGDMRRSENVEDRGGMSGGGGRMPLGGGMKIGGGTLVLLVILGLVFGVNPLQFLGMAGPDVGAPAPAPSMPAPSSSGSGAPAPSDTRKDFSARVIGDTEDVWGALFEAMHQKRYPPTPASTSTRRSSTSSRGASARPATSRRPT